jgi:uncharacterized protein YegL
MAFWIAALVVPALVILYFLKLRRREEPVPSTLLWKRAVQDIEVNAPFQRLRKNLLLLLQLAALLLAIAALARPVIETPLAAESSIVMLIDRSGSMNTVEPDEGGRTRLELAKEQAVRLVRTLNRTGSRWLSLLGGAPAQTRVSVIAFAGSARVVSPFTTNTADLARLIEELEPTDEQTNVREALQLAEAYMAQTRLEQTPETAEQASTLVMLSDGAFGDVKDVVLKSSAVKLVNVAAAQDNVGITAMRYQRNYEQPERLSVLLQVENFGPAAIQTDVSLYVNGRLSAVRTLNLGPGRGGPSTAPAAPAAAAVDGPGSAGSLSFEFALADAGVIEARLSRDDLLAVDNRAYACVPPPRKLSVLLVSDGNFILESLLAGLPLERVDRLGPAQYEAAPQGQVEVDGRSVYDVVVLDRCSVKRRPAGNYLCLGAAPDEVGVDLGQELGPQAFLWWNNTHPVLRHAALEYVNVAKARKLTLPPEAEVLIEGRDGPMLGRYAVQGRQYLLLSFAIEDSDWWNKLSLGVFFYNAIRFLGGGSAVGETEVLRPGATLSARLPADVRDARLTRPDGTQVTVNPDVTGVCRYADTARVGIYRVNWAPDGQASFAVNLEDPAESNVAPGAEIHIGNVAVTRGEPIRSATPETWRWFIGACLLIVLVEWLIYNRRVMI